MKTAKNLFPQIIAFENLCLAAQKAGKGKREQQNVMIFFMKLEENLWLLQDELTDGSYAPGAYRTFQIYDPKPRMISAAPFRDRVVHHALMNIAQPILERSFIYDSYANRTGKGTHKAIRRYQHFLRQYKYVLKCDIKKYFPTIDHEILKQLFRRCIIDQRTLWLMDTIVNHSNPQIEVIDYFHDDGLFTPLQRRKGLPIGNLTSQIFANFYLSPFDHFVREVLQCCAFLRYVDDFALFANSKAILWEWLDLAILFLQDYRLKLNLNRCDVYPAKTSRRFLGQVVFIAKRKLPGANVRAFRKRLRRWQKNPPENIQQRIASWLGHAKQADTKRMNFFPQSDDDNYRSPTFGDCRKRLFVTPVPTRRDYRESINPRLFGCPLKACGHDIGVFLTFSTASLKGDLGGCCEQHNSLRIDWTLIHKFEPKT